MCLYRTIQHHQNPEADVQRSFALAACPFSPMSPRKSLTKMTTRMMVSIIPESLENLSFPGLNHCTKLPRSFLKIMSKRTVGKITYRTRKYITIPTIHQKTKTKCHKIRPFCLLRAANHDVMTMSMQLFGTPKIVVSIYFAYGVISTPKNDSHNHVR